MAARMPVLFVGHGSPMNVVLDNEWSRGFAALADAVPRPRAILSVSAHWFVAGSYLTANDLPPTIHDFGGFPPELYAIEYPARGDTALVARVRALLGAERVAPNEEWGLDHGTWSVLHWMYAQADIPVVQLSIDHRLPPAGHVALGRALAPLRDEGVLILGSGNVVHNLRDAGQRSMRGDTSTPDWARRVDDAVADAATRHDTDWLQRFWPDREDGRLAHPSPDHYFPLLYVVGAADAGEPVSFPIQGFDLGSLSMRSIRIG